jgi:exonuclease SbcC
MRPVSLKLKGFTAFRDEQSLDFSALDLFAICGPTGSGKSSILDALTFALFGWVDRVGNKVSQLISHGQPRLSVILEFAIGAESYRVTRSVPTSGPTKVLLEVRAPDGAWKQAGEGSDRVRDVNERIVKLLGLDYAAFSRAVLLPQNRFADFLVGDARERRDILTELLGLDLFTRMARAAGEKARDTKTRAEEKAGLLATEYSGVSEEALAAARAGVASAQDRETELRKAGESVDALCRTWRESRATVSRLEGYAVEAHRLESASRELAKSFRGYSGKVIKARKEKEEQASRSDRARKSAKSAAAERKAAEARWGRTSDLVTASGKVEALHQRQSDLESAVEGFDTARSRRPGIVQIQKRQDTELAERQGSLKKLQAAQRAAATALEHARKADLVATLCHGLEKGSSCPVCGAKLTSAPPKSSTSAVQDAEEALQNTESAQAKGQKAVDDAQRAKDAADRDAKEADKEVGRLQGEVERRRQAVSDAERALAKVFAGKLPSDPAAALRDRLSSVEGLIVAERQSAEAVRRAEADASDAERALAELQATMSVDRTKLELLPVAALLQNVQNECSSEALGKTPGVRATDSSDRLAATASSIQALVTAAAGVLASEVRRHLNSEQSLLDEATAIVEHLLQRAKTFDALVAELEKAMESAISEKVKRQHQVEMITDRLGRKRKMEAEIADLTDRSTRLHALAVDLRSDRLIAFLQGEALRLLCAAGSLHLADLSDGRYHIVCEDDEFLVVDNWNGEEKRSIHTLSGGETFLASLALALSLSEQSRSLAVTARPPLDSLFLDEGFGSLDTDSLEMVTAALERLGGDGRMVGVISHIKELAERLPARVVVEKSPRGSRLVCDAGSANLA